MKDKHSRLKKTLVIYGRNAVRESLISDSISIDKLHLADSNRAAPVLREIERIAASREIPIEYKSRKALSYISRNAKQDQGVAADIFLPGLVPFEDFDGYNRSLSTDVRRRYILFNGVTNPQNLGMIIRNVAAAGIAGLILPDSGCADLGPLAIKASAGAVFRCPILRCPDAYQAAAELSNRNARLIGLDSHAELELSTYMSSLSDIDHQREQVFILGGESTGLDSRIRDLLSSTVSIPMQNGVESLNVAVTAALVAFHQS